MQNEWIPTDITMDCEEETMELKIKALSPKIGHEIPAPFYASTGAAAMDLHACLDEPLAIPAGQRRSVPTGLAIALPDEHWVALILARSGLGIRHGVSPSNCVGVIDSDYRGEFLVALHNHGGETRTVSHGDRIAQLVVTPVLRPRYVQVDTLDETQRGEGGFGSTGK